MIGVKALSGMFAYLDALRKSGETNMFGAAPYLMNTFGVERSEARIVLKQWMDTFSDDQPMSRAKKAMDAS